jgi:hypothetical protein
MRVLPRLLILTVLIALPAVPTAADVIYVDNLRGNDAFDGGVPEPFSPEIGPVRTMARATRLARPGDVIEIANTGVPYREPISLTGRRFDGFDTAAFTVRGNGAVFDGSQPVPPTAWRQVEPNLFRFTPRRKGFYLLLSDEGPLPEVPPPPAGPAVLPEVPENHWSAFQGSIYLRTAPLVSPRDLPLRIAGGTTGLTIYDVRHLLVENLTFQHWRVDGVSAHDLCTDVTLRNVTSVENGRAGVSVGGSSIVTLDNPVVKGNRLHSVLVTEQSGARLAGEADVTPEPTVRE